MIEGGACGIEVGPLAASSAVTVVVIKHDHWAHFDTKAAAPSTGLAAAKVQEAFIGSVAARIEGLR